MFLTGVWQKHCKIFTSSYFACEEAFLLLFFGQIPAQFCGFIFAVSLESKTFEENENRNKQAKNNLTSWEQKFFCRSSVLQLKMPIISGALK